MQKGITFAHVKDIGASETHHRLEREPRVAWTGHEQRAEHTQMHRLYIALSDVAHRAEIVLMFRVGVDVRVVLLVGKDINFRPAVVRPIDDGRTKGEDFVRGYFVNILEAIDD